MVSLEHFNLLVSSPAKVRYNQKKGGENQTKKTLGKRKQEVGRKDQEGGR